MPSSIWMRQRVYPQAQVFRVPVRNPLSVCGVQATSAKQVSSVSIRSPGRGVSACRGRRGKEKTESSPKFGSVERCWERGVAFVLYLGSAQGQRCQSAWRAGQDGAASSGREPGQEIRQHYSRGLWVHRVSETWQNRPNIRDISCGQAC